ncbi:unnamed protein product [Cladocopium goreaui]|uniref:Glutathione dehydrogenase (Ascorbate) n=1 Tax=Cladocopium goreaui TaxID=2562237 RepID=A0A9P1BNV3_9DINO|nr:unnamed protein product [Cladocopium goreaui]
MALGLKSVSYEVVPCTQDTKPKWLVEECGGKMPCVCHKGEPHVETSEILAWIEKEFPSPALQPTEALAMEVKSCGVFPAIAQFTKNTDAAKDLELRSKLDGALASLSKCLEGKAFLQGDQPGLLDCDILPKLHVLSHATAHYKGFSMDDVKEGGEVLRAYWSRGSALEAFQRGAYSKEDCLWGWGQARSD